MTRKVSLIVPVFFEEDCIAEFITQTRAVLQTLPYDYEYIFVDDGSKDRTCEIIRDFAKDDSRIKLIEFSYNHGKPSAMTAAITYASGDYLLHMDPDLQDPPHEIPRFLAEIEKGYDLVFGVRKQRKDSFKNNLMSGIFWNVLEKYTGLDLPKGLAVMRIFNRKFANQFLRYPEQNRFIEGMFMHVSMNRTQIIIDQQERFAGTSKFNFKRKMKLAFDAIFDYSELPLKLAVRFGLLLFICGAIIALGIIFTKLLSVNFQAGWPSLITAIIIGTGLQIFFIGIAAIYIGRIYKESKRRPLFSVKHLTNLTGKNGLENLQ